jgi:hypothetical protein
MLPRSDTVQPRAGVGCLDLGRGWARTHYGGKKVGQALSLAGPGRQAEGLTDVRPRRPVAPGFSLEEFVPSPRVGAVSLVRASLRRAKGRSTDPETPP